MSLTSITAASGLVIAPERVSNSVESQNQRQQEQRDRVDASRAEVNGSSQRGVQGAVTLAALRPVSAVILNSVEKDSDQLLTDEEVAALQVMANEEKALEVKAATEDGVLEKTAAKLAEQEFSALEIVQNALETKQVAFELRQEANASQLFIVQQQQDAASSFANLSRARDAFAAAIKLHDNLAIQSNINDDVRDSLQLSDATETLRLRQLDISENIDEDQGFRRTALLAGEDDRRGINITA